MTDERITAYLLEELTDEESERFEDELFAADEWETDLQAVEDDLIDAYLRRELSPERTRRFEENYLCTETRRERLTLAVAILRRVDELTPAPAPAAEVGWWQKFLAGWNAKPLAFRFVVVFALLLLFAVTGWYVAFRGQRQPTIVALSLTSTDSTRNNGVAPTTINLQGKDILRLTFALPESSSAVANSAAAKFEADIRDGAGQLVYLGPITHSGANLIVDLPAANLRPGFYQVKITASENGGAPARIPGVYSFKVE